MEELIAELLKKLLMSAASAAGSKIGGTASNYVLDLFGIDDHSDVNAIKAQLNSISSNLNDIETVLRDVANRQRWENVTGGFNNIIASITTHNTNLLALLDITDTAKRDSQIKAYLSNDSSLATLDADLTMIHNRMMGEDSTLTSSDAAFVQVYLETHWPEIWDRDPTVMHKRILGVYRKAAQMQRLATTLLVSYRESLDQYVLADTARKQLEPRLLLQFKKLLDVAPPFVMLNEFASPGLTIEFSGLQLIPNAVWRGTVIPERWAGGRGKPREPAVEGFVVSPVLQQPFFGWSLQRVGAEPSKPIYTLKSLCTLAGASDAVAVERDVRMYMGQHLDLIELANPNTGATPLQFSFELTDVLNVLQIKTDHSRNVGYVKIAGPGSATYVALTEPQAVPQTVILSGFNKLPVAGRATLNAWSRSFANTPAGEGRFKPGYRVRYRVIHVNRYGESAKSDWILAPKINEDHQDSDSYFGNASYYFPQIALGVDPTGRTEGYRIFRQFAGDVEEEVTKGTYTGNPVSGKVVIFDDFML